MRDIKQEFCALEDLCDCGQMLIERMRTMHQTQEERRDHDDFERPGISGGETSTRGK